MSNRVVHKRRATITDLPLYYSGHLRKKLTKEKDFKKYYGELRGATLFLYKDDTQDTYTEKLHLGQLKSMQLHSPYQKKTPTIFTLTLQTEEVQLQMDNSDTGEEWRGYILTVVKKEIPSKLQLLPGQMLQLQDALDQERRRNPTTQRPELPPRPLFLCTPSPFQSPPASASPSSTPPKDKTDNSPEIPACFFHVSRKEAEHMLKVNPECGSIILRPSTLANNYALTLRQQTSRSEIGPILKNFRVTSTNVGFVIELDTAVTVSSLNEVLNYFLEKTEYRLHPFMASQPYDTRIDMSPVPNILKTVPKAQVAPMLRSETKEKLPPPPTNQDDGDYVMPDDHDPNLKLVQMDRELEAVLKLRRESLYTETEEVNTKQSSEKPPSAAVQWSGNSSTI
ncbi:signal-transducing adaptor protein 1-like isoform X1 [Pseudochaenichthys georgianus]|uniref:signal-transducing adaptor protein 1-like isoform X1 n=1 Tax=Pseudochaenichthys georgianus TaxID=52239 RepID=UPI00146CD638|nr:signal-transducing adaptor protein 1-like isoform X1 [Pseudochaenichthys georgianus]